MMIDVLLSESAQVADASPETITAGRAALSVASARAQPPTRPLSSITSRRWVPHAVLGSVAAVATVVGLLGGPSQDTATRASTVDARAAAFLRTTGVAAGRQPGGWPQAKYWHVVSRYIRDGATVRREIWIGHHRAGALIDVGVHAGVVPLAVDHAGGLGWGALYRLPTDPTKLIAALQHAEGIHGTLDSRIWAIAGDLLQESPASPALRQALYEVAAMVPGVRVIGQVTDHAGRRGTALTLGGKGGRVTYVFDTSDGRLLENDHEGFVITYLSQGPAATAPTATADITPMPSSS